MITFLIGIGVGAVAMAFFGILLIQRLVDRELGKALSALAIGFWYNHGQAFARTINLANTKRKTLKLPCTLAQDANLEDHWPFFDIDGWEND